jgi:hypothetical protein
MTPSGTTARRVSRRYTPPIDLRFPAVQTRWVVREPRPTKFVLTFAPLREIYPISGGLVFAD